MITLLKIGWTGLLWLLAILLFALGVYLVSYLYEYKSWEGIFYLVLYFVVLYVVSSISD